MGPIIGVNLPSTSPCAQALQHRADGKLYRIQTPQTPIARTQRYNTYKMDEFPSGMNMIVAVLAYTGEFLLHTLSDLIDQ